MARFRLRRNRSVPPRSWKRRALIAFNCLLTVLIAGGIGLYTYGTALTDRIHKVNLGGVFEGDGGGGPMNVLLVGSDSRMGLDPSKFGSGEEVAGQRSDTIMILHVDPKAQRAAILSLPRDLWVPIAGTNGKNRINSAFDHGPQQLIQTIQQDFKIPIDHYAEVDFNGFKGIVNAIGGVQIPFSAPTRDQLSALDIRQSGCINLTGDQALAYVRSRHMEVFEGGYWQTDARSDLSRIDRQQDFMRRVMRKAVDKGSHNPLTLNSLLESGVDNLTLDSGFGLKDATNVADRFKSLDPAKVEMMTYPTTATTINGADVLIPKDPDAALTIDRLINGPPKPKAEEQVPPIPPSSISVRVLNGSGARGQATVAAGGLKDVGFVISGTGDARSASNSVTTVRYATGNKDKAAVIAHYIVGNVDQVEDPTVVGVDAVVTTGQNFTSAGPPDRVPAPTDSMTSTTASSTSKTQPTFVPNSDAAC